MKAGKKKEWKLDLQNGVKMRHCAQGFSLILISPTVDG